MKKTSVKKSGFAEGRSNTGPSRSSISDKKKKSSRDPDAKANKRLEKLNKARSDLADVFRDMGDKKTSKKLTMKKSLGEGSVAVDYEDDDDDQEQSTFAQDFAAIRNTVITDGEEFNAEAAHRMLLKSLFTMSIDLLPLCETALRNSKKEQAAYALIAMVSQTKDLSTELKMLGNVENQSVFIKESIIQPIYVALLQNFMSQFMHLKNTIDTEIGGYTKISPNVRTIKRETDNILRNIGSFMDASRDGMCKNIQSYLSGDMAFMNANSGGPNQGGGGKRRRGGKRQEQ